MKKIFLCLCLLSFFSNVSLAATIKSGERIVYKITKMGLKAGEATLTYAGTRIYRGKKLVLIVFQAKGFNFLDEERIFVDPKSFKPRFVERNLNIFGNKERILEEYTQGHVQVSKGKEKQIIDKSGEIDNIYAFIYRYRQNGSFKLEEMLDLQLPTKDVKIKVTKQDVLDVAKKKYDVYYMESESGEYKIWFDASEQKIPLRISGAVKMGDALMTMTKYEK